MSCAPEGTVVTSTGGDGGARVEVRTVDEIEEPCTRGELLTCAHRLFRSIAVIQQHARGTATALAGGELDRSQAELKRVIAAAREEGRQAGLAEAKATLAEARAVGARSHAPDPRGRGDAVGAGGRAFGLHGKSRARQLLRSRGQQRRAQDAGLR
mgnify:CR=1 FL=1